MTEKDGYDDSGHVDESITIFKSRAVGYSNPFAGLRPEFVLAVRAWCRYEVKAEAFDRTLPGVPSQREPDCWIPLDRMRSLSFAREARRATEWFLDRREVTREQREQAFQFVKGMKFQKQQELALSDEEFSK